MYLWKYVIIINFLRLLGIFNVHKLCMIPNACLVYSRHVKLLSSKKQRETEKEKERREAEKKGRK